MKKTIQLLTFALLAIAVNAQAQNFASRGVGGGGALFSPSINPSNDNEYYVACDMSELFHSTDYGDTYTQAHFKDIQGGHNSKMVFTSFANVRYCIDYTGDLAHPVKSIDNGATWSALPGNPDASEETYSIHADYNQPNHLIISYYNQIYFSVNGGTTFTLIHTAANSGAGVVVGGVFFDGNNIYIGTNDGIIVSVNNGTSFSVSTSTGMPAGERMFSFAGAKEGNTVRFFCLTADVNDIYTGIPGSDYWGFVKGVYAMDNNSGTWAAKMNGVDVSSDFLMFVGMAQNDITNVYLAGSNDNGEPNIMRTGNGGASWTHVFNTGTNQNIQTGWCGSGGDRGWGYAESPFGFAVAPNNSNKVIFSDFGFVHVSGNGGVSWKQAYISNADQNPMGATTPVFKNYHSIGLENTTSWNMAWADANNVYAAFSDINGIKSDNGGVSWKMAGATTQNSTYYFLKHSDGRMYAATSNTHDIYQTTRLQDNTLDVGDGGIVYTANNGVSWQQLHDFNHPVVWLAVDPSNANRMYASVIHYAGGAGEGGIWVTTNLQNGSTSTWTKLANPPRTEGHPFNIRVLNDGTLVASYCARRNASGTFTASSGVFKMAAGASSWTDVSASGMLYYTKDVVIDPYDATQNTWYACVWGGWGGAPNGLGGLYKTTNRGTSWTRIFNGADRVSSITFSPSSASEIWMTTETDGLWHCTNVNAGTPSFAQVDSYRFRQPERVYYNPYNQNELWVTSFGNGLKVASLAPTSVKENYFTDVKVYPNPASDKLIIQNPNFEIEKAELLNTMGGVVMEKEMQQNSSFEFDVRNLNRGVYLLKFISENKFSVQKIVLK